MCLITDKKLKFNIFPKTVYKVVRENGFSEDHFRSFFHYFSYKLNRKYKISRKKIINSREIESDLIEGYRYYKGFHSYISYIDALTFNKRNGNYGIIVECKIPAFSWIIKGVGVHANQILSNKIIIKKIMKSCV